MRKALLPAVFRTGGLLMAGHIAIALVGVAALRLYTELAPTDVFGEANLILGALTLGLQVFIAPFTAAQLRFHTEADARSAGNAFTRSALAWSLGAALALTVVALTSFVIWSHIYEHPLTALSLTALAMWPAAMAARNVFMNRLHAERRQAVYIGLQVTEAILVVALTGAALAWTATTGSFMFGQALAPAVLLLVVTAIAPWPTWTLRRIASRDVSYGSKALSYGGPFVPMSLLSSVSSVADRYALAWLLGSAAVGLYLAPFAIASRAMALVTGPLTDLFRPMLFDAENRNDGGQAKRIFKSWVAATVGVGLAVLTGIAVLGQFVVDWVLARDYRDGAVAIMLWIALAYTIYGLTQVLENRLLSLGQSVRLLPPMLIGGAANVLFSILLIPRTGAIGAAQANCASFLVRGGCTAMLLYLAFRQRHSGNESR